MWQNELERRYWKLSRQPGKAPWIFRRDAAGRKEAPQAFGAYLDEVLGGADFAKTEAGWKLTMDAGSERRITTAEILRWRGKGKPNFIFHHALGMYRYRAVAELLLSGPQLGETNIIAIRAQKHMNKKRFESEGFDSLGHVRATLAGSVAMAELLRERLAAEGQDVYGVGISLGGVVMAWHWHWRGTMNKYFPIVAYPNLGKILTGEGFEGLTDRREEREAMEVYARAFSSDPALAKGEARQIHPVLGRDDRIVPFRMAAEYWKKAGVEFSEFPYGHWTPLFGLGTIKEMMGEELSGNR